VDDTTLSGDELLSGRPEHNGPAPGRSVAAIVVTYNSATVIEHLLDSLASVTDLQVRAVILDNASSDDTIQIVRGYSHLRIALIEGDHNTGFGAGVNTALPAVRDDELVLLVNPDVTFSADILSGLRAALEHDPAAASITPALVNAAGAPVPTARGFPSISDLLFRRVHEVRSSGAVVPADWICGAFMLWRPGVLQSLGGFDERYFLFYEDVDVCRRASAEGWRFLLHGGLRACHDVGHSHRHSRQAQKISRSSRRTYASKHLGRWGILATIVAAIADLAGRLKKGLRRARSI
jgi:N-acetylglucosaminyl-diphospho-decaprenol L-rhamnosyltransferase